MEEKIIKFWKEQETKIVFLAGLILVAGISFQGGYLKGKAAPENPLVVEKNPACPKAQNNENAPANSSGQPGLTDNNKANSSQIQETSEKKNCAYVGSKNSNKYHLPACRYAKTIKSENLACFSSKEEAEKQGYQPDTNCLK